MNQDQLLKVTDVAERLSVSVTTVRRLIDKGKLQTVRIGRSVRIRPEDLEAYIESSKD